jgi:hypothetical protein
MKLWLFGSFALALSASFTALPGHAENLRMTKNNLPKVEFYKAPLQIQILDQQPLVTDLRQQESEGKYVMHIGELPPVPPEQIRPSAKSPVIREWGLPNAGFESHVHNKPAAVSKSDLPPVGVHRLQPEGLRSLSSRLPDSPSVLSRTAKPVPIASAYEPYSQDISIANSAAKSSARGKLIRP